jgi:hypothetical protein
MNQQSEAGVRMLRSIRNALHKKATHDAQTKTRTQATAPTPPARNVPDAKRHATAKKAMALA